MAQKKISALPNGSYFMSSQWIVGVEGGISVKYSPAQVNPFRGVWAGTTAMPTTGGRYTAGAPAEGDNWVLTNELVIWGNVYSAGSVIFSKVNTPGQTQANWLVLSVQL